MKTVLYALLLVLFISCDNDKPIEKITINGTVSDVNNNLLDSVKIELRQVYIMAGSFAIDRAYSKNGGFAFEFTPEEYQTYYLEFEKKGYKNIDAGVKNKEKQYFNIIMGKEVTVYKTTGSEPYNEMLIDITNQPTGTYLVNISLKGKIQTTKIIKK
jgi:hypothetical protein